MVYGRKICELSLIMNYPTKRLDEPRCLLSLDAYKRRLSAPPSVGKRETIRNSLMEDIVCTHNASKLVEVSCGTEKTGIVRDVGS